MDEGTWRQLWVQAAKELGSELDARRIVQWASRLSGSEWTSVLDDRVEGPSRESARAMLDRRLGGEPLQYILGRWGFRHLDLRVDKRALIPRPETEQVTEEALAELARLSGRVVVDLGTGSGAIAWSVLTEAPSSQVWAVDISPDALALAGENLAELDLTARQRAHVLRGSWFEPLPAEIRGRVDVVVSNPPYVSQAEAATLSPEVAAWEPATALVPGPSGLEAIAHVISQAPHWLARPGALVVEIAPSQAQPAADLARQAGFDFVEVRPDLAHRPRSLVSRLA
ncbi:MAG: peptide chain release factor N(5)-glutamine methyltransferase [Acidimicrobiales bacterium]